MPIFAYKGRSQRGELVSGRLEGETPEAIASRLFNTGIAPLEIKPADEANSDIDLGQVWRSLGGGKPNQYLDKKNLQPHKVLPEQREDLLNFLRSLTVDCKLTKPPLPQK